MVIDSIKCICGCNDFDVINNESGSPSGVYLECKSCGVITPIGFYDISGLLYTIVGPRTKFLFDESSYRDITCIEARSSFYTDFKESFSN